MAGAAPNRSALYDPDPLDVRELRRFGGWLGTGAIAGALIAFALTFVWTPRWEAIVHVRPGQTVSSGLIPTPVEAPARIVERLNSRAFAQTLKQRLGLPPTDDSPRGRLIESSLKASAIERAALVSLRVSGFSRDEARATAEAVLATLAELHAPMYRPTVERLQQQRREAQLDMQRIAAERERLVATLPADRPGSRAADRFSESVLIGNLVNIRDSELRMLRDRASLIDEMLSPERTYPTAPIDQVFVPERPTFPNTLFHTIAGAVIGGMVGVLLALALQRRRPDGNGA